MAHIRYGDRNYVIADSDFEEMHANIMKTLEADSVVAITVKERLDGENYPSTLYISRGVPVSVHEWDTTQL